MHQETGRKKLIIWISVALIIVATFLCSIWFASKGIASGAITPETFETTICETTTTMTTTTQTTTSTTTTVTTTTTTTETTTTTTTREYDGKAYPESLGTLTETVLGSEDSPVNPYDYEVLSKEWNEYWMYYFDIGWPIEGEYLGGTCGVSHSPNGFSETFYDMEMRGIVVWARDLGFSEEEYPYWIHPIMGTKMLGRYVIVAGDLPQEGRPDPIYQRGDFAECSLGPAIVMDTGGFAKVNPHHYDVAVDWGLGNNPRYPGFSNH